MILTEYNKELHENTLREDGRYEGKSLGQAEMVRAMSYLLASGRKEELERMVFDEEFRKQIILESE